MKVGVLSLTVHTEHDVRDSRPGRGIRVVQNYQWQGFEFAIRVPRGSNRDAINARAAALRSTGVEVTFHRVGLNGHRIRLSGPAVRSATHGIVSQPTLGTALLLGALTLASTKGPAEIVKPFIDQVNKIVLG